MGLNECFFIFEIKISYIYELAHIKQNQNNYAKT